MKTNSAIVDNWMLELVSDLLDPHSTLSPEGTHRYDYFPTGYGNFYRSAGIVQAANDRLESLFDLLDLVVLCEEILFDEGWSSVWQIRKSLEPVGSLLAPIEIDSSVKRAVSYDMHRNFRYDPEIYGASIVEDGAMYYLGLSRLVGINYWPSPRRSEFLRNLVFDRETSFILQLKEIVGDASASIIREALRPLRLDGPALSYVGLGAFVISQCDSREKILEAALQVRDTKEAVAFRQWLSHVEKALEAGNLVAAATALKEVRDLIAAFRARLIGSAGGEDVQLQIGLSPTLSFSSASIRNIFKSFRRKPYHLVFLRSHFQRLLENAMTWKSLRRIFPEFSLISRGDLSFCNVDLSPKKFEVSSARTDLPDRTLPGPAAKKRLPQFSDQINKKCDEAPLVGRQMESALRRAMDKRSQES